MSNTTKYLFQLILIVSELTEMFYDMGVFTRQHILPLIVTISVWSVDKTKRYVVPFVNTSIDKLMGCVDTNLKVIRTPLTTGLAY